MPGPLRVETARSLAELEGLRPGWEALLWRREEAAFPYFVARLQSRPGVIGPLAAIVSDAGGPVAGLAARLEVRQLATAVGYRVLYAPEVRALQVVDGGIVGRAAGTEALIGVVSEALGSGEADVALLPPLETRLRPRQGGRLARRTADAPTADRPLDAAPARAARELRRVPRLAEPQDPQGCPPGRAAARGGVRRARVAGGRCANPATSSSSSETPTGSPAPTYQRGLGAGFAATAEQRELVRIGLEHGWVRGYLLYLDSNPIAYWLCSVYDRTILLRTGGYDEAYADNRVGIYLLMRVIEDACADPSLDVLDFGPGDASYKQQFSNESREERNALVFAPTFRARRINLTRTAILAPARLAHVALASTNLTDRARARLRGRGPTRG